MTIRSTTMTAVVVAAAGSLPLKAQDLIFATHNGTGTVSVINVASGAVQGIAVGGGNNGIAVAPDGSAVYVVVSNTGVRIIDPQTLTVTGTVPVTSGFGIRLSPDGSRAYVTRGNPAAIFVIDLASQTITDTLAPISNAVYLDITPDGSKLFVSTSRIVSPVQTWVSVVDTTQNPPAIVDVIDIGRYPAEIAVTPDGLQVYVSNELDSSVTVLDRHTHAILGVIPVGVGPRGITFSAGGDKAYVVNSNSRTISIIDTATRLVTGTIAVPGGLIFDMQILDDGNTAQVSRWTDSMVAVVDLATQTVTGNIPLSARPYLLMKYTFPPSPCYANCDGSTVAPILNVEDFTCFINRFAEGALLPHEQQLTHYANCDQSTAAPVLNVEDFSCFINKFAAGCR
jgi:YVTN family beta-propeller protein